MVRFQPWLYKERAGLLLLNGVVYTAWSSQCDSGNYHGWIIGYDAGTLKQTAVFTDTPNWDAGSFWQGGAAPAADSSGNIYVVSANGTFDVNLGGSDFGGKHSQAFHRQKARGGGLLHALQRRRAERSRSGSGIERRAVASRRGGRRGAPALAGESEARRYGLFGGSRSFGPFPGAAGTARLFSRSRARWARSSASRRISTTRCIFPRRTTR